MKAKTLVMAAMVAILTATDLFAGGRGGGSGQSGGIGFTSSKAGASSHGRGSAGYTRGATYQVGPTTYRSAAYYRTGYPKVERNGAVRRQFLQSQGYTATPRGYQVDHVVPLSRGGTDAAYNMQLLTVEAHRMKTSAEAAR